MQHCVSETKQNNIDVKCWNSLFNSYCDCLFQSKSYESWNVNILNKFEYIVHLVNISKKLLAATALIVFALQGSCHKCCTSAKTSWKLNCQILLNYRGGAGDAHLKLDSIKKTQFHLFGASVQPCNLFPSVEQPCSSLCPWRDGAPRTWSPRWQQSLHNHNFVHGSLSSLKWR